MEVGIHHSDTEDAQRVDLNSFTFSLCTLCALCVSVVNLYGRTS